jgi:hypothetical protein
MTASLPLSVSCLPHTWLIDLDGTLTIHNAHLGVGDALLPGVKKFWAAIPAQDVIIILSARSDRYLKETECFLETNALRYDRLIMDLPKGERILINDKKPKGLLTAIALNVARNEGLDGVDIIMDPEL